MQEINIIENNHKTDPDPVSISLAVLGALGSLASIASFLEGRKHQRHTITPFYDPEHALWGNKSVSFKTKFRDRITKLDAGFEDLKGRLETLYSLLSEVEYIDGTILSEQPFLFGAVQPLLDKQDLALFFRIQNEVNQLCNKITKECQGLIRVLDDLGNEISPEIYSKTLQLRSMLNKAIGTQMSFREVFNLNLNCIETALETCEYIRRDFEGRYE